MRSTLFPTLALALVACGDDNDKSRPDARPTPDAQVDAPDAAPPECDYTEVLDGTNDNFYGSGVPESTGLSFGATKRTICGAFQSSHYNTGMMAVDVDSYSFNVPADASARLYLTAAGAENFNTVLVEIYSAGTGADAVGQFKVNYAVTALTVPAGTYTIDVSAFDDAAATGDVAYKLVIDVDSPSRCATKTGTADYPEQTDGVTSSGNDVYIVNYDTTPYRAFTTVNVTDAPEPTGLTIDSSGSKLITGIIKKPASDPVEWSDFYQDRDTYAIATGASTNELTLRLNWAGTTADLDLLVFPMNSLVDFADAYRDRKQEDEVVTFAVDPSTTYWVFVGADDSTTGQPIDYSLTACGESFTP